MSDARQPPLLVVDDLRKSFGALVAVDGVSFSMRPGEILGIAGPNGAGKTTLFNLITGIPFRPDRGRVTLSGRRIDGVAPHRVFRLGLARTFQKETAFADLTVEQNVRLGAVYGAALGGAIWRRASTPPWTGSTSPRCGIGPPPPSRSTKPSASCSRRPSSRPHAC